MKYTETQENLIFLFIKSINKLYCIAPAQDNISNEVLTALGSSLSLLEEIQSDSEDLSSTSGYVRM